MQRFGSALVLLSVAGFTVLFALAASRYPGGTWFDRESVGHRFWENYLCDLEWRTALNGAPNPGASLMRAAMIALVAGSIPLWLLVPELFRRRRFAARLVRTSGVLSAGAMIAVAFVPSERSPVLHQVAVVSASALAFVAATVTILELGRDERPPKIAAALGAVTLVFAVGDLALYVRQILLPGVGTITIPALQKLALLFALTWMVVIALRTRSGSATLPRRATRKLSRSVSE